MKSGKLVLIRSPRFDEGEALLVTMREIIKDSPHLLTEVEEFTYTTSQEDEMIQSYSDHPDKLILVPEVDGKIVGMLNFSVGARRKNAHQGEFGISLLPAFQGLGIGQLLLQALIEWARANPVIETLRLKVHAKNSNAIALYQKAGFISEGCESRAVKLRDGSYDDTLLFALHLH